MRIVMILRWVFVFGILLGGCASLIKPNGIYNSPIETRAYSNAYQEYKDRYIGKRNFDYAIEVSFSNLNDNDIGICYFLPKPFVRYVKFDYNYWKRATDDQKIILVFHELAHCDLDLEHQEDIRGIMNSESGIINLTEKHIENLFLKGL